MLVALSQPLLGWTLAGRGPAARPQREHVCMCAAAPAAAVTFNDLVSEAQRLTDEQCAKTLLEACCEATLCTRPAAMDDAGAGFASHVSYVPDEDGSPLFPLFDTATAANLQAAPQATFLAHAPAGAVQAGSATLLGAVEPYDSAELTDFQLAAQRAHGPHGRGAGGAAVAQARADARPLLRRDPRERELGVAQRVQDGERQPARRLCGAVAAQAEFGEFARARALRRHLRRLARRRPDAVRARRRRPGARPLARPRARPHPRVRPPARPPAPPHCR